ncbi:MAG TPA: hypothetical protein VGL05_31095 [Kribbella sp.]
MTSSRGEVVKAWKTLTFHPSPPGWRVLAIYGETRSTTPVAGWLVQEAYWYDEKSETLVEARPNQLPLRRVIPGICIDGWNWEVDAIDFEPGSDTWRVLGPEEPDPSDAEWADEIARRADAKAKRHSGRSADA